MDSKAATLQKVLIADPEYQALQQSFCCIQVQFRQVLSDLDTADSEVIYEYLGILAEMQLREIELALSAMPT